ALAAELAATRGTLAERDASVSSASEALRSHSERSQDFERRERELAAELAGREAALESLRAEAQEAAARDTEARQDLHAAEEQLHRLEAELRARQLRIDELTAAGV